MSKEDPIGVGILGAAKIANKTCRALSLTNQLQVVAVGSRDIVKAQTLISKWDIGTATAYNSYAEVLDDSRVQAVYIPLPTALHVEWVKAAASKGKHILLEKPIAVTAADVDTILSACAKANVFFMDGTMWTHASRTLKMKEVIHDGHLGVLRTVHASFTFTAPSGFEGNVRSKKDCDPLGALGDLGWYCVRAILWAYDYERPVSVTAHTGATFTPSEGVPISIGATLLFPSGRRGSFECGFDRALTQSFEVLGTNGSIYVNDFVIPQSEREAHFTLSRDHDTVDHDTRDATVRDVVTVTSPVPQEVLMWEKFAECVSKAQSGEGLDTYWADISELTQKVVCAVEDSVRNNCCTINL